MTYTGSTHLIRRGHYRFTRDGRSRSVHLTAPAPRRDDPALYHTPLISGGISDVAFGSHAVAMWNKKYLPGLENCVRIDTPGKPLIYVVDSHKIAYFAWHEAVATGHLEPGAVLVHIDRHSDALRPKSLHGLRTYDLAQAAHAAREILYDVTFIVPAVAKGLFSQFWNLYSRPDLRFFLDAKAELYLDHKDASNEYFLRCYTANRSYIKEIRPLPDLLRELNDAKKFTLDIDIDAFVRQSYYLRPLPTPEDFSAVIQLLAAMSARAGVVTLATSPGCADQRVAIPFARNLITEILRK